MTHPRLEVADLSKTFGPARVLRDVQLRLAPGELHGLVGQNGCGKSTLVKILTGVYTPDPGGSVTVDGRRLPTPIRRADQRAAGVSVVHQDLGLVDDLSVWENVRLGRYRAGRVSRRIKSGQERRAVEEILDRLGRRLDASRPVGSLSAEERATIAIARAVQDHRPGGGVIIFDESTRALGRSARSRFFDLVRSIIAGGGAVLLISHQLEEIVEMTDRVTVLRDGAVVGAGVPTREVDEASLTRMMLGRHLVVQSRVDTHARDEVVASARGLSVGTVAGLDLDARRGEIVGLTGLLGSGFEDVAAVLGGARRATAGELSVKGRALALSRRRGSTEHFNNAGIAYVTENRLAEGLAGGLSVADNLTLPRVRRRGGRMRIGRAWQAEETAAMIAKIASVNAADLAVLCDRVLVFRDGRVADSLSGNLDQDDIIHATFGMAAGAGGAQPGRTDEGVAS